MMQASGLVAQTVEVRWMLETHQAASANTNVSAEPQGFGAWQGSSDESSQGEGGNIKYEKMGRGEDQRVLSRWQAEAASGRPEGKQQGPCPSAGHSSQKLQSSAGSHAGKTIRLGT